MSKNKPRPLPTGRHRRNAILISFLAAVLIGIGIYAAINNVVHKTPPLEENAPEKTPVVVQEVQEQVEYTNENSPEKAREILISYYNALSTRDANQLRSIGMSEAASAVERKWLDAIGYAVDIAKITPDRNDFPAPVGLYAGCSIYNIIDFYTSPFPDSIYTDVTGLTSIQGWIYYNPIDARWVIVDPTIPTAIAAPQTPNIERYSEDRTLTTKIGCPGAFANPWWCYARIDVSVSNASAEKDAIITPAVFDNGMNLIVPEELQGVCQRAEVFQEGEGENVQIRTNPTNKTGSCILYRGIISNFGIDRIGAQPQSFDGNITPVVIEFGEENVSPIFVIGKSTAEDIQSDITQATVSEYNITDAPVAIDPNYPTTFDEPETVGDIGTEQQNADLPEGVS